MSARPTKAVLNALAAIELYGNTLPYTTVDTRLACYRYSTFPTEHDYGQRPVRFRLLNDDGRALLEQSPLWKAAKALEAAGYERNYRRRSKPGFIAYKRTGTTGAGSADSAWISGGERAYVYTPADAPRYEGHHEATILYPAKGAGK